MGAKKVAENIELDEEHNVPQQVLDRLAARDPNAPTYSSDQVIDILGLDRAEIQRLEDRFRRRLSRAKAPRAT
jgi:hypothetical protein